MSTKSVSMPNRPAAVIGILLVAIAAITYWDASRMVVRATYGMSASAASYFVAILFVALAVGHFVSAFRPADIEHESVDWKAVGWVLLALAGLIGAIWLNGGFILGATILFAFTARAFGRRAILLDLLLGALIGLAIFLLFNKILTLALPQGPFERLF